MVALAGRSPFGKNGSGDSGFAAGGARVPFTGGVLGSDYNHRHHTVVAGSSLRGFLGMFLGDPAWSSPRCDRGNALYEDSRNVRPAEFSGRDNSSSSAIRRTRAARAPRRDLAGGYGNIA